MTTDRDNPSSSSEPIKTLELRTVSDRTGNYPQLFHGGIVVNSTTAAVLESSADRGSEMRGRVVITWNDEISEVWVEGWTVDAKARTATQDFSEPGDVMQCDSAYTVKCKLSDQSNPATDAPSGWTGPSGDGVWTLDPYVRLRRKTYTLTQTT
ncbi:MAG: hypothetical protein ACRBN8_36480 [Nannocystales bacterium]